MPNSLKCRLKKFVHKGLLSENDLSRIYTDNDVIAELEKIKAEMEQERDSYDLSCINTSNVCIGLIDKYIEELKGE